MIKKLFHGLFSCALAVLPAALFLMPLQEAKAQWVVSDPGTETNTFFTHVTQLLQYIKDVQMALNTLNQATMMGREVVQLVRHPSTNILQDMAMFSNVLQQSQGLAMNLAQMDVTFRNQFSPFSPSPLVNYASQYTRWSSTALNAFHAAANSAGYQGNMLVNETGPNGFMAQMQQLNTSNAGQDQLLGIANSVGMEEVAQLQKLRMLMVQNIGSNNAFYTAQMNAQTADVNAAATAFATPNIVVDPRTW
jgi:P-type conjugative transfer protein TrbJ